MLKEKMEATRPQPTDWARFATMLASSAKTLIKLAIKADRHKKKKKRHSDALDSRAGQTVALPGNPAPERNATSTAAAKPAEIRQEPPKIEAPAVAALPVETQRKTAAEPAKPLAQTQTEAPPRLRASESPALAAATSVKKGPAKREDGPRESSLAAARRSPETPEWSHALAWREVKRTVARLSDTGIAMLISSPELLLLFVQHLAAICTPPRRLRE